MCFQAERRRSSASTAWPLSIARYPNALSRSAPEGETHHLPLRVFTLGDELRDDGRSFSNKYEPGNESAVLVRPGLAGDTADDPLRQLTAALNLALGGPPTSTRLAA